MRRHVYAVYLLITYDLIYNESHIVYKQYIGHNMYVRTWNAPK